MTLADLTAAEIEELRQLEESLWRPETRVDPAHMERVLAPDFLEFGRSGRTYDRTASIAVERVPLRVELPLPDFAAHPIGRDAVLTTYVSVVGAAGSERSNRASLWIRAPTGWLLRFHQGTPTSA